jgi:hypothetical protein
MFIVPIIPIPRLKFWASLFLVVGRSPETDRPIVETVEPGTAVLLNTATHRVYVEEQPEGWRLDSPAVLRRAYLLYSDG